MKVGNVLKFSIKALIVDSLFSIHTSSNLGMRISSNNKITCFREIKAVQGQYGPWQTIGHPHNAGTHNSIILPCI